MVVLMCYGSRGNVRTGASAESADQYRVASGTGASTETWVRWYQVVLKYRAKTRGGSTYFLSKGWEEGAEPGHIAECIALLYSATSFGCTGLI